MGTRTDSSKHRLIAPLPSVRLHSIGIIEKLADTEDDPVDAAFFRELERKVEWDRDLLKRLIGQLGESSSTLLQAAGSITGTASRMKLARQGIEPGQLGRFEALERSRWASRASA